MPFMGMPGEGNRLNKLTRQPVLPEGWNKVGTGLWRNEVTGEESRINPSSMITNNNFASLKSADSPVGQRASSARHSGRNSSPPQSPRGGPPSPQRPPLPQPPPIRQPPPPPPRPPSYKSAHPQPPPPSPPPLQWWYMGVDNSQRGPVSAEQLSRLYDNGVVHSNTYLWSKGVSTCTLPACLARHRATALFGTWLAPIPDLPTRSPGACPRRDAARAFAARIRATILCSTYRATLGAAVGFGGHRRERCTNA